MKNWLKFCILISFCLSNCRADVKNTAIDSTPDLATVIQIIPSATEEFFITSTFTSSPTIQITSSSIPLNIKVASPTIDPYYQYSIEYLQNREYGGGVMQVVDTLADNSYFTRYLISYPSDGLTIYGFMNVPKRSEPPYPVVIALHGYIEPEIYNTLDYTTRYADALSRAGFLVLHPNLRGYPPSDDGDNLFRVGMAVDVLNLIEIIKGQSGQNGSLEMADPNAIGLWGHSMGGGIATRVMTISEDVRAVLLYGAMSADEQQNFERIRDYFSNGQRGLEELKAPNDAFKQISPIYFIHLIDTSVSIHHGENDKEVPLAWSKDLCNKLNELGNEVDCYLYPDQGHTFFGEGDELFMQRMINFYQEVLIDE